MKEIDPSVSRRKFLGGTAAVAGTAAITFPAVLTGKPNETPIRFGLVGCGGRGT